MVGLKIGLDIGTGSVTAAIEGKGIVLSEPAVLALEAETNRVLAAGKDALEMTGRCPDAIKLVRPLLSGSISDLENSKLLLRTFIERICKNKIFKPTVAATMPAGLTNLEKRNILECVLNAGAGRAVLIEEPLAAALGTGVMLDKPYGTMIVNVGAGTTSVAVVTMGSVAVAKSAKIGGSDMDKKIKAHLKNDRGVAVGKLTAEEERALQYRTHTAIGVVLKKAESEKEIEKYDLEAFLTSPIELPYDKIKESLLKRCGEYISDYCNDQDLIEYQLQLGIA